MRLRLSRAQTWAVTLGAPLGAALLSSLMVSSAGIDTGFLPVILAVVLVAWIGGGLYGLAATGVGCLATLATAELPMTLDPAALSRLGVFATAGVATSLLIESLHRARRAGEQARDRERAARRAAQALRAEYESLVAAIGDGIAVCEPDGGVRLLNEAATRLLGTVTSYQELTDRFVDDEGNPATLPTPGERRRSVLVRLAGGGRWVELTAFPLHPGVTPPGGITAGSVLLLRDVTAARQRGRLRQAFLSLLSHELRTPLTAIYGNATLLRRPDSNLDQAARRTLVADLAAEADRMTRLIEDLLVLARVEEGDQPGLEPELMQHLVPAVVEAYRELGEEHPVEVQAEPGLPPVAGDETSVGQVVRNFLSNAAKYSPIGSPIEVRVDALATEVEVRVLDRGKGISAAEAEQVFDAFYRSAAAQRMASGDGVGLFVCRRLVEAMGGRIWARPREGGGSEFGFALRTWQPETDETVERPLIGVA